MNGKLWIRNQIVEGSILIDKDQGIIKKISKVPETSPKEDKIIDLKGKLVIPGLIDIHCHLRDFKESQKETFETGSKAAAAGGYTTVFDMPNKLPPIISSKQLLEVKKRILSRKINIIPYLLLTEKTEKPFLYTYPYIKAYLGFTTGNNITTSKDLEDFLKKGISFLSAHCEDNSIILNNLKKYDDDLLYHCDIRSPQSELSSINQLIKIKRNVPTQSIIHIAHLTLVESLEILLREGGSFEVTPHHLFLNKDDYSKLGTWGKMNPPLRTKSNQKGLLKEYINGRIPIVATDHAPHLKEEKENYDYSGIPGLETALPLILNALQPLNENKIRLIVNTMSLNPRRLMKLPISGILDTGKPADLTIINLDKVKAVHGEDLFTKCKWSPWEGLNLQGWPVLTINKGLIVYNGL